MGFAITDGKSEAGAYILEGRKKPVIAVIEGNEMTVCGSFNSKDAAEIFMEKLAKITGAVEETNFIE